MKKLIIIISALLILLTIPPYFVGSKTETHIKELVELSNQNPTFDIEIVEYNKGWFFSTAKIKFTLTMAMDPELNDFMKMTFIQEMQHGPLLWKTQGFGFGLMDSKVSVELPEEWQKALDKVESINEDTLQLTSRTAFDGSTLSHMDVAAIQFNEQKLSFDIKPTKANFYYNQSGHITGNLDWQGMEIVESGMKIMDIGFMHAEVDEQLVRGKLFLPTAIFSGSFDSTIKSIAITPPSSKNSIQLTDLSFNGHSVVREELIDVHVVFSIADIKAMKLEFTDFVQDISILNLDINVLQELNEQIIQMQENAQQIIQKNGQQTADIPSAELFKGIQSLLPKMLAAKPVLKVNKIGITTTDGRIEALMDVHINADLYDPDNPKSFIKAMVVDASGQAPEAFFTKFGMAAPIEQLIQQNMLIREDQLLLFKFNYSEGQGSLNGNPIPLGANK